MTLDFRIVFILGFAALPALLNAAPEYQFSFGTVRGVDSRVQATGRLYYTYYGIPFAEPPVADRRFKPPVPFRGAGSNVVVTSDDFPLACSQPRSKYGPSGEDCLTLTMYTPASSSTTKKVMVFIQGGALVQGGHRTFECGSMATENDVIVAVVQYRVGVFGWISSGDEVLPGNLGLRDQILAISWVKENIATFGGDPEDITVIGHGLGAVSATMISLSPLSNGLFKKVITMSGSAANRNAISKDPTAYLYWFADKVGCKPWFYFPGLTRQYHQNILDCLMGKRAEELILYVGEGPEPGNVFTDGLVTGAGGLAAVIDGDVIPRNPSTLLADEDYLRANGVLDRAYVIGVVNNEGGLTGSFINFIPGSPFFLLSEPSNVAVQVKGAAKSQFRGTPSEELLNVVDFVYTYPRNGDGSIPLQQILDLNMDGGFLMPSMKLARALADKTPVYFYLFDHYPQLKDPSSAIRGTSHGVDIIWLFDQSQELSSEFAFYANVFTPESELIPAVYRATLTSFAKTGVPTYPTNPSTSTTASLASWPRYDLEKQEYLAISAKPEVRKQLYAQRVSLWLDFLPKMAKSGYFSSGSERVAYD